MGAKRLKFMHDLKPSHQAIGRILKEHGLAARRPKKHKRKASLREVKKHWKLFGQFSVDTKELKDIPHYWPQMKALDLPRYQFTAREIRSGLMFLGYAREQTAVNACTFIRIILQHLRDCGIQVHGIKCQTDNGHEFIGCKRQDGRRDGFGPMAEAFGAIHKRIPIKAWSYNSDVETVHRTIEDEFFDLEDFSSPRDFLQRVGSYQAWYNLLRPNMNKDNLAPWQIITKLQPNTNPQLVRLPPLMLDWLAPDYIERDEIQQRGYDVAWHPYLQSLPQPPAPPENSVRFDSARLTVLACDGVPWHYSCRATKDGGIEIGILMVILALVHGQDKLIGPHARRSRATGLWTGRPARAKPGDLRDIAQDSVSRRLVVSCGGMNGEPE
jgi:hypothetical protein